jgi:hypothetical protein
MKTDWDIEIQIVMSQDNWARMKQYGFMTELCIEDLQLENSTGTIFDTSSYRWKNDRHMELILC